MGNVISRIISSLSSRHQSASNHQGTYCFPVNTTANYSSSVWVRDYGSGLYMRVPV